MDSMFNLEMDYEKQLEIPENYGQLRLSDLDDGEIYSGKPLISDIQTVEFEELDDAGVVKLDDDGNIITRTIHKIRLVILDEIEETYLDININLKSKEPVVKQIRKGSVLFDFIQSILELENKGCTEGKNIFRNVNLQQFIDFVGDLKTIGIKNVERYGRFNFNSFYVVQVNGKKIE